MNGECEHAAFRVFGEVRAREGFGRALRVFAQCVKCGTPLRFEPQPASIEGRGLVVELVGEPAGD